MKLNYSFKNKTYLTQKELEELASEVNKNYKNLREELKEALEEGKTVTKNWQKHLAKDQDDDSPIKEFFRYNMKKIEEPTLEYKDHSFDIKIFRKLYKYEEGKRIQKELIANVKNKLDEELTKEQKKELEEIIKNYSSPITDIYGGKIKDVFFN